MKNSDIANIYRNSPTNNVDRYILNLLNKFEVALAIDEEHLILPSLLPTHLEVTLANRDSIMEKVTAPPLLHYNILSTDPWL